MQSPTCARFGCECDSPACRYRNLIPGTDYPFPTDLERFNGTAWESVPDGSLPAPVALEIAEAIGGGMAISDEFITRDGTLYRW